MRKHVVVFEAAGGSDKGPDGHRRDTMPIVEAIRSRGWSAESIFYSDEERETIQCRVLATADAYLNRINPGAIPGGEALYFEMLRELCSAGIVGLPHPDVMVEFGAKDALVKFRGTGLVPPDIAAYYSVSDLRASFPASLAGGPRVLKQNRGAIGQGIWLVSLADELSPGVDAVPLDARVKCIEAVDNHVEHHALGDFLTMLEKYLGGKHGAIVDMPFLPRVVEGEIRILMVGSEPMFVVQKKPAAGADAFSATLFSGAIYSYEEPAKWQRLVDEFLAGLPEFVSRLGGHEVPVLWSADFIRDTAPDGSDSYLISEINCACVGFTTQLYQGIQEKVADEVIRRVTARAVVAG